MSISVQKLTQLHNFIENLWIKYCVSLQLEILQIFNPL